MDHFNYVDGALHAEGLPVQELAEQFGTPLFIYSRATLERHWHAFDDAFGEYPHDIHYAVKANGNLGILSILAKLGSGFDIVSGGELKRVIAASGDPKKVIFSGVGKLTWEIELALEHEIECFNVESMDELQRIAAIAKTINKIAKISIRVNPDVDAKTHPYISTGLKNNKFGITFAPALACYQFAHAHPNLQVYGVACHIGSQMAEIAPIADAMDRVLSFVKKLKKHDIQIEIIDFGGGLGVKYKDEIPPSPKEYWHNLQQQLQAHNVNLPVVIEPGRAVVANAGLLLTQIEYLKKGEISNFCVVDAAMNDLIRPALYSAYHEIIPVKQHSTAIPEQYDVVGPICESADFLGKDRKLCVEQGDLLAIRTTGAYCFSQASNYNARPRAAELVVDGKQVHLVRQRETIESLYALEMMLA